MVSRYILVFFLLFPMWQVQLLAQDAPIGSWESHLPYNTAVGLASHGNTLYTLCNQSFFSMDGENGNAYTTYSKTDGMHDIGMQCAAYDDATSTLVLTYSNGNIDLLKDNTFYNVPGLKSIVYSGSKNINQAFARNGIAYIATAVGIVVVDLTTHEVSTTIQVIYNPGPFRYVYGNILGLAEKDSYFYAVTDNGVFRALTNELQNTNAGVWKRIDSTRAIVSISGNDEGLYMASKNSVYQFHDDSFDIKYTASATFKTRIRHLDACTNGALISEYSDSLLKGSVKVLTGGGITDSISCIGKPQQALQLANKTIWIADSTHGLQKAAGSLEYHAPQGPSSPNSFDLYCKNKELYIAHGEYNRFFGGNFTSYGISSLKDGQWTLYTPDTRKELENIKDITTLLKDEKSNIFYAGSFLNGLVMLEPGNKIEVVNSSAIFDGSFIYGPDFKQVIGLGIDKQETLWASSVLSEHQLYAKSKAGDWFKYKLPGITFGGPLVVDDNGQVYFLCFSGPGSGGIAVFNSGGTLDNTGDDAIYHMLAGKGYGNLPSNNVLCIAKDNKNNILAGTDNGIAVVSTCTAPFSQAAPCDATLPVVQFGRFPGPLFEGAAVNTIAIDAVNRKWIGTDEGVWLLNDDMQQVILHFTEENSPLPSDHIQKITVDDVTGDVYIGTDRGLVCYRATITAESQNHADITIFPNPVKADYHGPVAIRGIMNNADVRITDVNGQLVYAAKAENGGQIVWNGLDYTGHKPQSGVYLVFTADSKGKNTNIGKIVFIQ